MESKITKTKTGEKIHKSYKGSSISFCGIRAFEISSLRGASEKHFCRSCFGGTVEVGFALRSAFLALK